MKRLKIDQEFARRFNTLRIEMQNEKLSKEQVIKLIRERVGFTVNSDWLAILIKYDILKRSRQGKKHFFTFSEHPVYVEKLRNLHKEVKRNKIRVKEDITEDAITEADAIMEAIKLLKNNGYKILKQVINYEEI